MKMLFCKHGTPIIRYVRYLVLLICILTPLRSLPQTSTNSYAIDEECYQYLLKIKKLLNKPATIIMCDTLKQMAVRKNDLKAECISYNLKTIIYSNTLDMKLAEEFPKYKEFIEKTPYRQYLYNSWVNLSRLYQNLNQFNKSIKTLEEMCDYAVSEHDYYGVALSYSAIGTIYFNHNDWKAALGPYEKAYQIKRKNNDPNIANSEYKLGLCYYYIGEEDKGINLIRQSVEHSIESEKFSSILSLFNIGIKERIKKSEGYVVSESELDSLKNKVDYYYLQSKGSSNNVINNYCCQTALYYDLKHDIKRALAYTDSVPDIERRLSARRMIFENNGMWDSAFINLKREYTIDRDNWRNENQKLLANIIVATDSSALSLEYKELQIRQLKEREQILQLEQEKSKLLIRNGDLELVNKNNELLAKNQKLELAESNNKINLYKLEKQKMLNREIEQKSLNEKRWMYMICITLFILLIFVYVIMRINIKSKRRLAKEKDIAVKAQIEEKKQKTIALKALSEAETARNQAERADNLKTLFLQNMSHEIRTPLNAIVGFSELLNTPEIVDAMDAGERAEMSRLIVVNSNLLLTLVNDILDISKLESGTYQMAVSSVDASLLCHDSLISIEGSQPKDVKLELDLPEQPVTFNTDKTRMQQVLTNFLTNACKNTTSGKIVLGYRAVDISGKKYLRFFVEDSGCGVPEDKMDDVFKRFEKLDVFKQGTGLGLNICQLISKLVNGNIYVDRNYSNGARFVFEHPL